MNMKTTFSHKYDYRLTICCIFHCMAATLVSGIIFYMAKQNNTDTKLWILSGLLAASISVLLSIGVLRLWKPYPDKPLIGNANSKEERPGEADKGRASDKEPAFADVIDRLLLAAECRGLGHESANFLNNVDLVVHGLKNENLSIRGKHILQLLTEESTKVKAYMKKQKGLSVYPKLCGELQNIKHVVEDVVQKWISKSDWSVIPACKWIADPGVSYMNKKLIGEALFNLLEYAAGFMPEGGKLEIQGNLVDNKPVIYITHENPGNKRLNDLNALEPYTLSIARVIIEAHGGTLCKRELTGNQELEVFLPMLNKKRAFPVRS